MADQRLSGASRTNATAGQVQIIAPPMLGEGAAARELRALIDALARHECTVLILPDPAVG